MKFKILFICATALVSAISNADPVGTAFTYQGQLALNGAPVNGNYDFTFNLYNTNSQGTALASPVFALGVGVTNGLFVANLDFGNQFGGQATWLEIAVRSNNIGNFVVLAPRQELTPTPYAISANSASNLLGSLDVSQLNGALALSQLPGAVVTNNATGVNLSGSFSGDGSGLLNTVTSANYVSAYDTTIQTPNTANVLQGVTFAAVSSSGWTYSSAATNFTCNKSGMYFVEYDASVATSSSATTISLRGYNQTIGAEILGSECFVTLTTGGQQGMISKSFLATFNAGDALQIQFASQSTSAGLAPGNFDANVKPSITMTIIRIQ